MAPTGIVLPLLLLSLATIITGEYDCNVDIGEVTGDSCILNCTDIPNGDYQSCQNCHHFITCSNGYANDMPCPAGLVWDDNRRKCEESSPTCQACEVTGGRYVELVSWDKTRLDMLVVRNDGSVDHRFQEDSVWSDWIHLGGNVTSAVTAVSPEPGVIEVFGRGTDDAVWHNQYFVADRAWSGWTRLGGLIIKDFKIGVGVRDSKRIDVFVIGANNDVYHNYRQDGKWHSWHVDRAMPAYSGPSVISSSNGNIDILVRGAEGGVWHLHWDTNSHWGNWYRVGGVLVNSDISSVPFYTEGRFDIFSRNTVNDLVHTYHDNNGWHGWDNLNGGLASAPCAVSSTQNTISVFVNGLGNNWVWVKVYWMGHWGDWVALTLGVAEGGPVAVARDALNIDVAYINTNNIGYGRYEE